MLEKKCPQFETLCVYYSQWGTRKPINYCHVPNKQGDQKFDHPCPQGLSFVDRGEHLILVLLYKTNLECQEIPTSDWLKSPISMWLTLVFHVLHSRFGFALQEAYL